MNEKEWTLILNLPENAEKDIIIRTNAIAFYEECNRLKKCLKM